jgi:uncharacterized protein YkwD
MNRPSYVCSKKLLIGLCYLMSSFSFVAHADVNQNIATEILVYINQYRVQHGLPKLVMNALVSTEATNHSLEMATAVTPFGHDGFSGRMTNLHKLIPNSGAGAENVAFNYKTAEIVANGWIKSPGHRKNILGGYNLTGIGIAKDKQGKLYYTQMFLRSDDDLGVAKTTNEKRTHHFFLFG